MKLRILQVVSYYPPALSFGGPPQVMFDLAKELVRRGHCVSVYTTDALRIDDWKAGVDKEDDEIDGIMIRRFARMKYSDRLPTKFLKLLITGIDGQCAQEMGNFDIVHISEITNPFAVKCSSWATKKKIPYVTSVFSNLTPYNNMAMRILRNSFDHLWGRKMLRDAAALLVQTPHEGELCAQYTSGDRIVPMFLPIDMTLFQNLPARGTFRRKYFIGESEKIILFLGRIHKGKGLQLLVEAFADLLNEHRNNYRLVIAGTDDGYRRFVVKHVQQLGIEERVTFTGPIFGGDKLEAYVDADVFVLTSPVFEETSLAVLEACACYTPIIVTQTTVTPGLEEYEAGFYIRYDKEELGNTLIQLLDNSTLMEKMGRNARRLVEEKYALEKVVDKLENLFLKITKGRVSQSVTGEHQEEPQ